MWKITKQIGHYIFFLLKHIIWLLHYVIGMTGHDVMHRRKTWWCLTKIPTHRNVSRISNIVNAEQNVVITPCIAVILLATIFRISSIVLVNLIIVSYVMRIASLSKHAMLPSMDGNAILSLWRHASQIQSHTEEIYQSSVVLIDLLFCIAHIYFCNSVKATLFLRHGVSVSICNHTYL